MKFVVNFFDKLFDWVHVRLMHRRGYRRFSVTSDGRKMTGWARAMEHDPRFPTVTHRGWTDDGMLITFHGYAPPEEHAAPK